MNNERLIKSRERVRDRGEVFTPDFIVRDMCDLIPAEQWTIEATFLEPACGNGNFLVEIFRRKLQLCKDPRDGVKALASIVGIDIMPDNCEEARERLLIMFMEAFPDASEFAIKLAADILRNNIICGDSLKILNGATNMCSAHKSPRKNLKKAAAAAINETGKNKPQNQPTQDPRPNTAKL